MPNKPMPVGESRQEIRALWPLLQAAVLDNWPDTGLCLGSERGADVGR